MPVTYTSGFYHPGTIFAGPRAALQRAGLPALRGTMRRCRETNAGMVAARFARALIRGAGSFYQREQIGA